ncbi:hypothetical protein EMG21_30865 [Klebsiella pneumoniae]|nr:hypothetical protein EMG21_30865 [Klebsiella pneumoniae]
MLAVIDTLKHPSPSVNPDNQESRNVIETGVLFNFIVSEPKRLFKALIHRANCLIPVASPLAKFPLNKKAKSKICEGSSTIHL